MSALMVPEQLRYCANLLAHVARMLAAYSEGKRYNVDRLRRGGMVTFPLANGQNAGAIICFDETVAAMCVASINALHPNVVTESFMAPVNGFRTKAWEITIRFALS